MSDKGNNRDNGMFNWFSKCVPCFNPAKEQEDRTGRSGDGSSTPRTIQRREDSKGKSIASSQDSKGKSIASNQDSKGKSIAYSSQDSKGKSIAYSSQGDVGSNMGTGGDVVGSNRGGSSSGGGGGGASSSDIAEEGPMFWTTKDERHRFGYVSSAVIQGNITLEDFSQVEMGRTATLVGIYDGHGGYQAAIYVSRTLTKKLMECIRQTKTMSADILREAFLRTEASWLEKVDERFRSNNYVAGYGTCCLVGVFWRRTLYLANAGDSRAVIARATEGSTKFEDVQLTRDDNVRDPVVRAEVMALHPNEPGFVVEDNTFPGVFRIKGRIQVSKSIGDAYLKRARFNLNHLDKKFKLNSPVRDDNPALSADPSTYTISIGPQDRFVIFASDGLWDKMSNEEAVRIVQAYPKEGIAEILVKEALTTAATDIRMTYEELLLLRRANGHRRKAHDDISVVVIFFDHTIDQLASLGGEIQEVFIKKSIRQGSLTEGESNFTALDELVAEEEETALEGGDAVASLSGGGGNVASSSGGEGDAVASLSGGGGNVASSSGGEGDAVASSSGGGGNVASSSGVEGDAVASSSGGGGNVASSSGGEGDVASSSGGEGDVAS